VSKSLQSQGGGPKFAEEETSGVMSRGKLTPRQFPKEGVTRNGPGRKKTPSRENGRKRAKQREICVRSRQRVNVSPRMESNHAGLQTPFRKRRVRVCCARQTSREGKKSLSTNRKRCNSTREDQVKKEKKREGTRKGGANKKWGERPITRSGYW